MELTKEQIKNLLAFLNRVDLKGTEAEALVEIKLALFKKLKDTEQGGKNK